MTGGPVSCIPAAVGISGAYLLMFGMGWSNGLIYLGIVALMGATLCDFGAFRHWAFRSPAFWCVLLLSGYLLLRGLWAGPVDVVADRRLDDVKDMIDVAGLPALALGWWCARRPTHIPVLLVVAAVGLVLGTLLNMDWSRFSDFVQLRRRLEIGLGGNGTSFFGGALMIGALAYFWPLLASRVKWNAGLRLHAAGQVLTWLFGLELLLMGQTRTAWMAMVATLVIGGAIWVRRAGWGGLSHLLRTYWLFIAVVAIVCIGLIISVWDPLITRVTREAETWRHIASLEFDAIRQGSIGIRLTAWHIGIEAFLEHPWFGTGIGTASQVMDQSNIPIRRPLGHFHSVYLQVLVTTGLAGFVLAGAVVATFIREALRGPSSDPATANLVRFAGMSGLYLAVASLAIIRYDDPHGMAYMILIAACAVAPGMRRSLVERAEGKGLRGKG